MIGLSVRGASESAAKLRRASSQLREGQLRGTRTAVALVQRAVRLEMTGRASMDPFWGKGGAEGNQLAVRTGRTRASVTGNTFRYGDRAVGVVGSKEAHLKLHESGGTVQGTSPKGYARIPTAAAKTAAGVDRNAGRSIRDIPGAFLFTSKSGRLWAAVRRERTMQLLYLLVHEVKLRPRGIFSRVAREQSPRVVQAMQAEVALVVRGANA